MSPVPRKTEHVLSSAVSKRQQGLDERRHRLIRAASDLIAERGDGSFSMPELARRAGVSLATPYNLFGSKAAILIKVFERLIRGFDRNAEWMVGEPTSARMFGVIDRLVVAYEKQGALFRNLWKALYGLDALEQGRFNSTLSVEIVRPLVTSLARDALLPPDVPADTLERTLVRIFDANFQLWAAQNWSPARLGDELRQSFALVFLGLVGPSERDLLMKALASRQDIL